MTFYGRMQGTATKLLTRFNQGELALYRHAPGSGPAHNPGPGTWTGYPLRGTVGSPFQGDGKHYLDSSTILESDLAVTIAVPAIEPNVGDVVSIDGVFHTVVARKRLPEAGTPVAFKLFVRLGGR